MSVKKIIFLFLNVILMGNIPDPVQDEQQYALKAAFIYHFIQYTEWSNINEVKSFDIAVLGESRITKQLLAITQGEKIRDKEINVNEYEDIGKISNCQILFIPQYSKIPLESITSKFAGKPVLIIAEKKGYAEAGAHINFFISEDKLKFEINLKAANKSGIKISALLLQHAKLIA